MVLFIFGVSLGLILCRRAINYADYKGIIMKISNELRQAVKSYIKRKYRIEHPQGTFDRAGRWYPDVDEKCECCWSIRQPSGQFPYSLMVHCRSAEHIVRLYEVDQKEFKRLARLIDNVVKHTDGQIIDEIDFDHLENLEAFGKLLKVSLPQRATGDAVAIAV